MKQVRISKVYVENLEQTLADSATRLVQLRGELDQAARVLARKDQALAAVFAVNEELTEEVARKDAAAKANREAAHASREAFGSVEIRFHPSDEVRATHAGLYFSDCCFLDPDSRRAPGLITLRLL